MKNKKGVNKNSLWSESQQSELITYFYGISKDPRHSFAAFCCVFTNANDHAASAQGKQLHVHKRTKQILHGKIIETVNY